MTYWVWRPRLVALALVGALCMLLSRDCVAGKLLRVRFTAGEKLRAQFDTDVMSNAKVGAQEIVTSEHQTFDVLLETREASADGGAVIGQRFERMRVKTSGSSGEAMEFDSAAKNGAADRGIDLLGTFRAIQAADLQIHCDARGRVTRTNAHDVLAELTRKQPKLAARLGGVLTDEGVRNMTGLGGVTLPDTAVEVGDVWTTSHERTLPLLGKQTVKTEYTYLGPDKFQGQPREKIGVTMQIDFRLPQNLPLKMEVVEQQCRGAIWLDDAAGRVSDTETKQDLTLRVAANEQTFQQLVTVSQYTSVRPADEVSRKTARR